MRPRLLASLLILPGLGLIPDPRLLAQGNQDPNAAVIKKLRDVMVQVHSARTPNGVLRRANLGSGPVPAESLRLLKQLGGVHTLEIHGQKPKLDEAALIALGELEGLHTLAIDAQDLGDDDLKHLARLTSLRKLKLPYAQVNDAGLTFLERLTNLQTLDLSWARRITGEGLAHLEGLTGLRELWLNGTRVDDAGLAHLAPLKGLRTLDLTGTPIRGPGLAHLDGFAELARLSLNKTRVDSDGLDRLGPAAQVRLVDVSDTAVRPAPLQNPAAGLALKTDGLEARVIDAATGNNAGAAIHHAGSGITINCWAISPDGRLVATGSAYRSRGPDVENKGTLWIWDARTGQTRASQWGGSVLWVAFRPDGKTVLFQAEPYLVDGP